MKRQLIGLAAAASAAVLALSAPGAVAQSSGSLDPGSLGAQGSTDGTGLGSLAGGSSGLTRVGDGPLPGGFKNLVVIYQENHSFDNLFGNWGPVGTAGTEGLDQAPADKVTQVDQDGKPLTCLPQNDVNLAGLPATCTDAAHGVTSAFPNTTFRIDDHIPSTASTCPAEGQYAPNGVPDGTGEPGGCTRDLVHRFYQEQYQLNGGKMNRYVAGSDAAGLPMGVYDTRKLPLWQYLHAAGAPNYVVADRFHQAAFGGSFLNHQFLISGRAPLDTSNGGMGAKFSVVDSNGMPGKGTFYAPKAPGLVDGQLTQKCADGGNDYAKGCGAWAVNTTQSAVQPHGSGAQMPLVDSARYPTIGDQLSAKNVSWNWYSGGWDAAAAGTPGKNFQFHHQPFNYFSAYAPGQPGRTHLQDETRFFDAAKGGSLPAVSFVKPYGNENEHPGYASASQGSDHTVDLIKAVTSGPQAKDTLVVLTYDEFGGQWDHVTPPGMGGTGPSDAFGPGTRIPAFLISAGFPHSGVDKTSHDTTSILKTLQNAYGLEPLSDRVAKVSPLNVGVIAGGLAG